jgi:hypothetical protein
MVGLTWISYYGFFLLVRNIFYRGIDNALNFSLLRNIAALLFALISLPIFLTKINELFKSTFMVGPISGIIIAITLWFYQTMVVALLFISILIAGIIFLIRYFKKPWFYYYATLFSLIVSLLYAWPR